MPTNFNSKDGTRSEEEIRKANEKYIKQVVQQYKDGFNSATQEEEVYGEHEAERKSYFQNLWNALMGRVK